MKGVLQTIKIPQESQSQSPHTNIYNAGTCSTEDYHDISKIQDLPLKNGTFGCAIQTSRLNMENGERSLIKLWLRKHHDNNLVHRTELDIVTHLC